MELLSKTKTGKVERPVKVLQFGEGNFLRAFVDYMIDIANESGDFNGDIVLVSDYQDVINSCFEKEDDQSFLPFMCTAFGDLFAYVKNPRLNNYVVYLNVRYGTYLILPANLRAIFNKVMVNESFLKGWFDLENYPIIQEKLGTPDYDECFGYSLLLALGGSEDIENIKIVKTIPYIDICTQTIGEFEIADKW